jgi:hypothetical protein
MFGTREVLICLALLLPVVAFGKDKEIPPAPLPAQITQARTAFITNGGGSEVGFDAFYQEIKQWGKYQIVGSPDSADLIIELTYGVEHNGNYSVPVYNSYTKQTTYYSGQIIDPQLKMTIYDAKSKAPLWSSIDHRKVVRLERNVDKEIVNSAVRLVNELKSRSQ